MKLKLMTLIAAAALAFGITAAAEEIEPTAEPTPEPLIFAAVVGDQQFSSLQQALNAAKSGDTVTLIGQGDAVYIKETLSISKSVEIMSEQETELSATFTLCSDNLTFHIEGVRLLDSQIITGNADNCNIIINNCSISRGYPKNAFILGDNSNTTLKLNINNNYIEDLASTAPFISCKNTLDDGSAIQNNHFNSNIAYTQSSWINLYDISESATVILSDNSFCDDGNSTTAIQLLQQNNSNCKVIFKSNQFANFTNAIDVCGGTTSNAQLLLDDGNVFDNTTITVANIAKYANVAPDCVKWLATSVSEPMKFVTTDEVDAGYYFDILKKLNNGIKYTSAEATFTSGVKTLSSNLVLPNIVGDGNLAFSVLLLGAPSDVEASVVFQ